MLAHISGALSIDDVMSYNSLTAIVSFKFLVTISFFCCIETNDYPDSPKFAGQALRYSLFFIQILSVLIEWRHTFNSFEERLIRFMWKTKTIWTNFYLAKFIWSEKNFRLSRDNQCCQIWQFVMNLATFHKKLCQNFGFGWLLVNFSYFWTTFKNVA